MIRKIHGIDIQIIVKSQTGTDRFNQPVYTETAETVHNVLVGQPTADEVTETYNLTQKKVEYVIAVPKGDAHKWENTKVILPPPFSGTFFTVGYPTAGIEEMIPLEWNKKVKLVRYG